MRRLFALGVSGLSAVALGAACGSTASPLAALGKARANTAAQHTIQESVNLVGGPGPVTVSGSGGYDLVANAGRFTVALPPLGPLPAGTKADAVLESPVLYANVHGVALGPKPWIKFDLRALPSVPGVDVSQLKNVALVDPRHALDLLLGATSTSVVGPEPIGAAAATHERVSVDINRAIPKASAGEATALRTDAANFTTSTFAVDVWVGADALIHKIHYAVMVKGQAGGLATQQDVTLTFTGFGAAVAAGPPPADQTVDVAALLAP